MKSSSIASRQLSPLVRSALLHFRRWFKGLGSCCIALALSVAGCGGNDCSPTLYCGACDHAIEIIVINEATGQPVGFNGESLRGMELVGEEGECSSVGGCYVYAKDKSPETLYEFDLVYRDQIVASYSLTPEVDPVPGRCCRCGYDMRTVELTLNWEELSQ